MRFIRWIVWGGLALVLLVFALSNRAPVALKFFPFESVVELPLYLFFFAVLLLGVLIGGIFTVLEKLHEILAIRRKDQTIKALRNELDAIKTQKKIAQQYQKSDNTSTAMTQINN